MKRIYFHLYFFSCLVINHFIHTCIYLYMCMNIYTDVHVYTFMYTHTPMYLYIIQGHS